MPEHSPQPSQHPESSRPRYDLSTIQGIPVGKVEVLPDAEAMARDYLDQLAKDKTSQAAMAEMAWAFRSQLQQDLKIVKDEDRKKLLGEDESHGFSLAVYRRLLTLTGSTLERELLRHEKEKNEMNGTYEEFKTLEKTLNDEQTNLNSLLAEMFKHAGQEPKPVHLAKRALLESRILDLESKLSLIRKKNPDVAALIEYDTIADYADQLRTNGFIWTKSRQKLLHDVLTSALTSRPMIMLMGETGTGKTAMARAAAIELASQEPERTVGGDQEKFVRLLASPAIGKGGETYWEYGPLLRAMTGRVSSLDTDPGSFKGGHFFVDDEYNTRPVSVQRQIAKFCAEARAGRTITVPGTPLTVKVESGFLHLALGNPPSERYDREETGIETKREFAGNVLNVEYLEQTPYNPELYQVLMASLLDQKTKRLTAVTADEIQPDWVKDAATGEKNLNLDPKSGAFLWRFSQAWGELFNAFSHKDTVLHKAHPADPKAKWHLPTFILDPGVVISWIDQYKASPKARKGHLADFLTTKLHTYIQQFGDDEQNTVNLYLAHFAIPKVEVTGTGKNKISKALEVTKPTVRVLTPREVGYLNPNVKRPKEKASPPKIDAIDLIDPDSGDVVGHYVKQQAAGFQPGIKLVRKDGLETEKQLTFLGLSYNVDTKTVDENAVVIQRPEGHIILPLSQFTAEYERFVPPTPEVGKPFAYDKQKAKEYGFSEMKIESHEKAQQLVDAIYAREPAFVVIHKIGDKDPDDKNKILTQEKIKVNLDSVKLYWSQHCPDLPDAPEKSSWFFQALAEHRLTNTIDADDVTTITTPTSPHIPAFGQSEFLLTLDFKEFDWDNATDKQAAITPQTKAILKKLFGTEDPTNLKRNDVNTALWSNHENRVPSTKAKEVIAELLGAGTNPDDFELRLLRYDEYARAAATQGFGQKNLWTHFDGYYAHGVGPRAGLNGGLRGYGGAGRVGHDHRELRGENLAVRVVLSRKS